MINSLKTVACIGALAATVAFATSDKVEVEVWTATWCGPCKSLKSYVKGHPDCLDGKTVVIRDIDLQRDDARKANVRVVPTTIIKVNGAEAGRLVGFRAASWAKFVSGW